MRAVHNSEQIKEIHRPSKKFDAVDIAAITSSKDPLRRLLDYFPVLVWL